jgi:hypothetical protein
MSASVQPAGIGVTVKATPFDTWLLTVTRTGPEDAPDGTTAVIAVVFQLMTEAVVPLKETVLVPWIEPKLTPPIVTEIPTKPDVGERLMIPGSVVTVKVEPVLATPDTVTTKAPVVAPGGTLATIYVEVQLVGVTAVPLNATVLDP